MGRGAWWATVHGVAKSQTRLRDQHLHCFLSSVTLSFFPPVNGNHKIVMMSLRNK